MELKKQLREALLPLYRHLLESVSDFEYKKVTFCMQWGSNFPTKKRSGFLFVGRATNGWISSSEDVDVLFGNSEDAIFARSDQMQWVNNLEGNTDKNGYNTRRSAFWRVIKSVTKHFYPQEWYSHIAWSNVCKVAPGEGNPSDSLYGAQVDDCCKILEKEIEILSPSFVIMLTGDAWSKDFISFLNKGEKPNSIVTKSWDGYNCNVYKIEGVFYVVSEHPQSKPEDSHVLCLIDLITNLQKTNII